MSFPPQQMGGNGFIKDPTDASGDASTGKQSSSQAVSINDITSTNNKQNTTNEQQNIINLEPDRLVPISTIFLDGRDSDSLLDLLEAKTFEHKLDVQVAKEVFTAIRAIDEDGLLDDTLERVDAEIKTADQKLSAAASLFETMSSLEKSMIDPERTNSVLEKYTVYLAQLDEHPDVKIKEGEKPPLFTFLSDVTGLHENYLKQITSTHLYVQLLEELRFMINFGGMPSLWYDMPAHRSKFTPAYVKKRIVHSPYERVNKVGLSKKPTQLSLVGLGKNNSGADLAEGGGAPGKIPQMANGVPLNRVRNMCSQLASEFSMSAGLGRLEGDPSATLLGVTHHKKYALDSMIGSAKCKELSKEKTVPDSLADFAVVSKDGSTRASQANRSKNVALLDPYNPGGESAPNVALPHNAKTGFFDSVKLNPTDNQMDEFDSIMSKALNRWSSAEEVMKKLFHADEKKTLLSSRGLFIRVLEEFSSLISVVDRDAAGADKAENLVGLHFLNIAGLNRNQHDSSHSVAMKEKLLLLCCRLLNKHRISQGSDVSKQARFSSLEGSPAFSAELEDMSDDQRMLFYMLVGTSEPSVTCTFAEKAGTGKKGNRKKVKGFAAFGADSYIAANSQGNRFTALGQNTAVKISGEELLDLNNDSDQTGGFLKRIVSIYEDLEKEAMELAESDGGDGSFINSNRLTKANGFDAAVSMMMILECFCILASVYAKTKFVIGTADGATSGPTGIGSSVLSYFGVRQLEGVYGGIRHHFGMGGSGHYGGDGVGRNLLSSISSKTTGEMNTDYRMVAEMNTIWAQGGKVRNEDYQNLMRKIAEQEGLTQSQFRHISNTERLRHTANYIIGKHAKLFLERDHVMTYQSDQGGHLSKGRQALLAIIEAAKSDDLDSLFDIPGNNNTFNPVPGVMLGTSFTPGNSGFNAARVINAIKRTTLNDVVPMRVFYICASMIRHLDEISNPLSRKAALLRGADDYRGAELSAPSEEEKVLTDLASTETGRDLLALVSRRQIEVARHRMRLLKNAKEINGFQPEIYSDELLRSIKLFLEEKQKTRRGAALFFGLGPGKVEQYVNVRISTQLAEEGYDSETFQPVLGSSLSDMELKLSFHLKDEFNHGARYHPMHRTFPLDVSVDEVGIKAAFNGENTVDSMDELVRSVQYKFNTPMGGAPAKIAGRSLVSDRGFSEFKLRMVLESYILKKAAKLLLDQSLEETDLIVARVKERKSTAREVMTLAAQVFGFESDILRSVFSKEANLNEPDSTDLARATLKKRQQVASTHPGIHWLIESSSPPKMNEAQFQNFLNIFNSKPLFEGDVEDTVVRPSTFDYVFASFVDLDDFSLNRATSRAALNKIAEDLGLNDIQANAYAVKYLDSNSANDNRNSVHLKSLYSSAEIQKRSG